MSKPSDGMALAKRPEMPEEFWEALAAVQPYGIETTAADVKSWFDLRWPVYSTHNYTRHRRAIAAWWAQVWEPQVREAIDRRKALEERSIVRELESRLPAPQNTPQTRDYFGEMKRRQDPDGPPDGPPEAA